MPRKQCSILFIVPYFYPAIEFGGPVTAAYELSKAMKKEGFDVKVLTTDISEGGKRIAEKRRFATGIKTIYSKSILPKWGWQYRFFLSREQVIKGTRLIKSTDVVHFQDFFVLSHFFLSLVCRKYNKPYLITPHGSFTFKKERGKSLFKVIFYQLFIKCVVKHAAKIVAVSKAEKKQIESEFPDIYGKVVYLPNSVSLKDRKKVNIRKKYTISQKAKIVLFLGRVYRIKGVEDLIGGFNLFLKKSGDKNTVLIFAGPDAGSLTKLKKFCELNKIEEYIRFIGLVKSDLKASLLKESTVLCLPSFSEGLPMVILESSYFSKPAIVTEECNVDSLVRMGGALKVTHQPADIAVAIEKYVKSEKLCRKMGRRARDWFGRYFSPDLIAKKYRLLYENLV